MKIKIFIILAAIGVLSGCGDRLDIKPVTNAEGSEGLKTSKDIEGLLVGAYSVLGDGDVLGGNMQRDAELMGDDGELFWDGTFVDPGEIWLKNMLITNGQAEATYLDCYRVINTCNTVLANLDIVIPAKVDRVEGEAKFLRGLAYFELVRVFGRTWTDGTPATNPGVPIVLTPNNTEKVDRSSVAAVYTQVINDLQDAETLLPEENTVFATTYAASAILSRVYMMQNNYTAARDAANRVIQSGLYNLLEDYEDNFNNSSNEQGPANAEDVFSVQVTKQLGINNMNTFFASADFAGRGDIYVEVAHTDLYEVGDDRLNLFYDGGERTGKWNNQFGSVNIVRLAEMYLTRAEANFRIAGGVTFNDTGALGEPTDDINEVRLRVGLGALTTIDIDDILLERHLELAFEGHLIHDLKRTQRSVGAMPYNDPKLIFPIPNRERIINPDMAQNDDY